MPVWILIFVRKFSEWLKRGFSVAKDLWIPACGGTEPVFTLNGRRWQYCWNPAANQHRYLDVDADRIVEDVRFHPSHAPEFEFTESERRILGEVYYF